MLWKKVSLAKKCFDYVHMSGSITFQIVSTISMKMYPSASSISRLILGSQAPLKRAAVIEKFKNDASFET